MIDDKGQETVTVKKSELLDVLKKNRAEHRDTFERALKGFHAAVVKKLDEALADARAGRKYSHMFALTKPEDQTKDYDRVIKMVEMSVSDTVTLTKEHFACYVMDDWRWKDAFRGSTAMYLHEDKGND
jgi:hypothetical protein